MELYQAVVLGIIQGLTEFLPISSSGHLVMSQYLFGLKEPEIFFDVCLHVGTLVAVIIYFRKDIFSIISTVVKSSASLIKKEISMEEAMGNTDIKMALLIIVGTVPTVIAGLLIKQIASLLFSSVLIVGMMLILTGFILWVTQKIGDKTIEMKDFSMKKALAIGVVQGLAVTPGISRSGSTIAIGLFLGLNREIAARYSFLLSIPAIAGAALLSLKDIEGLHGIAYETVIPGMLISAVVGYLALSLLVYIVKKGQLHIFAPYCWVAGCVAILLGLT